MLLATTSSPMMTEAGPLVDGVERLSSEEQELKFRAIIERKPREFLIEGQHHEYFAF